MEVPRIAGDLGDWHVTKERATVGGVPKVKLAVWRPNRADGHTEVGHRILDRTAADSEIESAAQELLASCRTDDRPLSH